MMKFTTDYMDNYYFKPWTRAPPYMIGIWTGWFLHRAKQSKLQIPRVRIHHLFYIILLAAVIISTAYRLFLIFFQWIVVLFWTLSAVIAASIIYGLTPYLNEALVPTIDWAVTITYGPLHRTAWALIVAWVIVACIHGYGGEELQIAK